MIGILLFQDTLYAVNFNLITRNEKEKYIHDMLQDGVPVTLVNTLQQAQIFFNYKQEIKFIQIMLK